MIDNVAIILIATIVLNERMTVFFKFNCGIFLCRINDGGLGGIEIQMREILFVSNADKRSIEKTTNYLLITL